MTISKIYISAFGKLKDYTLDLTPGFNVVFGENENGKTTVMAFLRMMFYGSGRAGQQLAKNPRKKYTPWSGGRMGGRIYFTHGGRSYCLEREFRGSDSTDRITLRDLDLGKTEELSGEVGSRFFGIGAAAFERSVFIGQAGAPDRDDTAEGELNTRLSNLALTGDEETSYQTVSGRLEKAGTDLFSPRHAGKGDKAVQELDTLRNALTEADESAKKRAELTERAANLKQLISDTKKQYEEVKKTVDSEQDIRKAGKLREYLDAKKQLDAVNADLQLQDGGKIDEMFLGKINFCVSKYNTERQRAAEKQQDADRLRESIDFAASEKANPENIEKIDAQIAALRRRMQANDSRSDDTAAQLRNCEIQLRDAGQKKKAVNPPLLVIGIILLLAAVGLYFFTEPLFGYISAGVGAVGLLLAFLLRPLDKSLQLQIRDDIAVLRGEAADLRETAAELQEKINSETAERNRITAALNTDQAVLEQRQADLAVRTEELEKALAAETAAKEDLLTLLRRCGAAEDPADAQSLLQTYAGKTESAKQLKLQLKYLSQDLGGISYEDAQNKLDNIENATISEFTDFDSARNELQELGERGSSLTAELSATLTELKTGFRSAADPERLEKAITATESKIEAQKNYCAALQLARKVLEDSFAEVRQSYGAVLEQKTADIFSRLTGNRYPTVSVSKSLELAAEEKDSFGMREIGYLSRGTADQAYLSLRLALSGLISGDEPLPVFLDDVLAQYDDTRTDAAVNFLADGENSTQTVLFTCHKAICEIAQKQRAEIVTLINK